MHCENAVTCIVILILMSWWKLAWKPLLVSRFFECHGFRELEGHRDVRSPNFHDGPHELVIYNTISLTNHG